MHRARNWANARPKGNPEHPSMNHSRRKLCKNSPFWTADLDMEQHRADWAAGKQRELAHRVAQDIAQHTLASPEAFLGLEDSSTPSVSPTTSSFPDPTNSIPTPIPPRPYIPRPPLDSKLLTTFTTNHSAVLGLHTIFTPTYLHLPPHPSSYDHHKSHLAPWPTASEMKYEGDDRIATDALHGRTLGAPRVPGNETVNWQHRAIVPQYALEDFLSEWPCEVSVWMRGWRVEELEFSEEEGRAVLGEALWRGLDPGDQFLE